VYVRGILPAIHWLLKQQQQQQQQLQQILVARAVPVDSLYIFGMRHSLNCNASIDLLGEPPVAARDLGTQRHQVLMD
jgi:hypothetical protein